VPDSEVVPRAELTSKSGRATSIDECPKKPRRNAAPTLRAC
jgi:hypothetical protein